MTANLGLSTYPPNLNIRPVDPNKRQIVQPRPIREAERRKYAAAWEISDYHDNSPGARHVDMMLAMVQPRPDWSIIDIGAGDGAASRGLLAKGFSNLTAFDLTDSGWDRDSGIPLHTGPLWTSIPGRYALGYCCDVMEHIPTSLVGLALSRILESCDRVFFSICFIPDHFGAYVGEPLHLTVQPFLWWRDLLRELGTLREARDLIDEGVFYLAR